MLNEFKLLAGIILAMESRWWEYEFVLVGNVWNLPGINTCLLLTMVDVAVDLRPLLKGNWRRTFENFPFRSHFPLNRNIQHLSKNMVTSKNFDAKSKKPKGWVPSHIVNLGEQNTIVIQKKNVFHMYFVKVFLSFPCITTRNHVVEEWKCMCTYTLALILLGISRRRRRSRTSKTNPHSTHHPWPPWKSLLGYTIVSIYLELST